MPQTASFLHSQWPELSPIHSPHPWCSKAKEKTTPLSSGLALQPPCQLPGEEHISQFAVTVGEATIVALLTMEVMETDSANVMSQRGHVDYAGWGRLLQTLQQQEGQEKMTYGGEEMSSFSAGFPSWSFVVLATYYIHVISYCCPHVKSRAKKSPLNQQLILFVAIKFCSSASKCWNCPTFQMSQVTCADT